MVFARSKLLIEDDLLRPKPVIKLHYSGPRPTRFYKEIPALIHAIFKTHTGQLQEKKLIWTRGDPEKFSVEWTLEKDMDKYTYYDVDVRMDGSESKGVGTVSIAFEGLLRTEYPQDTVWERSLFYEILRMIWHNTFYDVKRDSMIRDGRRLMAQLQEEMKTLMGEMKGD